MYVTISSPLGIAFVCTRSSAALELHSVCGAHMLLSSLAMFSSSCAGILRQLQYASAMRPLSCTSPESGRCDGAGNKRCRTWPRPAVDGHGQCTLSLKKRDFLHLQTPAKPFFHIIQVQKEIERDRSKVQKASPEPRKMTKKPGDVFFKWSKSLCPSLELAICWDMRNCIPGSSSQSGGDYKWVISQEASKYPISLSNFTCC